MPKASYAKDDMYAPSGRGFVETVGTRKLGEITAACSRYLQWQANKATGKQQAPLTSVIFTIREIDASGNQIAEPIEQELVAEWGPKDGSLIRVRPGIAESRETDAVDTAENGNLVLGAEGNCFYVDEGIKINMQNSFAIFVLSCQEKGFKPQVLAAGYLPDFIGLRGWFTLKPGKKKDDGTAYNDFVVDEITRYPYEARAGVPSAARKTAVRSSAAPVKAAASNGGADTGDIALSLLKAVAAESGGKGDMPRQKIVVLALQKMLAKDSGIDKSAHKTVQEKLKDAAWFAENAVEFGAITAGDDNYSFV